MVWGILIHPFPPDSSLSSANLLYREGSGLSGGGVSLIQTKQSALGWLQEDVRIWKLNRTYTGEKPPSLSLFTQGGCFATCKPTQNLLVMPNILVRLRALYESPIPPTQELRLHLSQDFFNIFDLIEIVPEFQRKLKNKAMIKVREVKKSNCILEH